MVETIELSKPIIIDDVEVRELTYDIESITTDQFLEADVLASDAAMQRSKVNAKVAELDSGFHFYLGIEAVIAANPDYSVEDVKRVKGPDIMKLMRIGRNFMTAGAEADEEEDSEQDAEPENYQETQD